MKSGVCILAETYFPIVGGGENQARLLAEMLVKRDYTVTVLTRRTDVRHAKCESIGGVEILRLPPVGHGGRKRWGMVPFTLGKLWRERERFDVVLALGYRALGIACVLAQQTANLPCVFKAESTGEMSGEFFRAGLARFGLAPESWGIRQMIEARNRALRRADAFVALSTHIEQELLASRVQPARIRRIPNGVDTDTFHPCSPDVRMKLRASLGISPEDRLVIYTGRLVSYKGLPSLVRAWRGITREMPFAQLLLVGEEGDDIHGCEAELRSFVRANDLEGHIRFTGAVELVAPFLQAADAFVLPTENEALPVSLLEAMACGLPCIATSVGGIPDIITAGKNGIIIPAGDIDALTDALRTVLDHPDRAARLGQSARETVVERFSVHAVTDAYTDLIDNLAIRVSSRKPIFQAALRG